VKRGFAAGRWWCVAVAAIASLWTLESAGMRTQPAEKFFSGPTLTLAQAIEQGDVAEVDTLLRSVDLNKPGAEDMTLLFFALQKAFGEKPAQLEIITHMVKAGADPLHTVEGIGSALGVSLQAASPLYVKALLDAGVSVDTVEGTTPILFKATREATFDTLKLLVERGADVNKRDSLGNTALMQGLTTMQLDQVEYLLAHGAKPDFVNINGVSFAGQLQFQIGRQQEGSPAQKKMLELRDRIVALGAAWPPASRETEQERMRARGQEPGKPLRVH
jgi:ankyrin repeat protein